MRPIIRNIILAILVIVVILVILHFINGGSKQLSGLNPGTKAITIKGSKLASSSNSNNFAYSIWFYVSDWQNRLTETKDLLVRNSNGAGGGANPHISLAAYQNNININIDTIQGQQSGNGEQKSSDNNCSIRNFPLQRWVNLIVSLNGRTLDVYLDGKLVRTCILSNVAKPIGEADINLTPNGGFSGWTSKLQFWAKPLNPQEAFNVYREGPGGSSFMSMFNRYKVRVTYLVDNVEQGTFSI